MAFLSQWTKAVGEVVARQANAVDGWYETVRDGRIRSTDQIVAETAKLWGQWLSSLEDLWVHPYHAKDAAGQVPHLVFVVPAEAGSHPPYEVALADRPVALHVELQDVEGNETARGGRLPDFVQLSVRGDVLHVGLKDLWNQFAGTPNLDPGHYFGVVYDKRPGGIAPVANLLVVIPSGAAHAVAAAEAAPAAAEPESPEEDS